MEAQEGLGGLPMAQDQVHLLDAIDRLRSIGLADLIDLPQLIVCGDQSSGKSSVLESISGIKFPVNTGMCTKFPIEIKLRRSEAEFARVKIVPGSSATTEIKQRLEAFSKESLQLGHDPTLKDVPTLIESATKAMEMASNRSHCDHRLQLEISGPKQRHVTLVDLPGLINSSDSRNISSPAAIRALVMQKMQEKRTLILVVMCASLDDEVQAVPSLIRDADLGGRRMLGILTKPDLIDRGSERERIVLKHVRNEIYEFQHGWHVVRNAKYEERDNPNFNARAAEADFFAKEPWSNIDRSQLGADALGRRLSRCLFELIQQELPSLIVEIDAKAASLKHQLARLGESRASIKDKQIYLTGVAEQFTRRIEAGVNCPYYWNNIRPECTDFRPTIRRLTDNFAKSIEERGRTYRINSNSVAIPIYLDNDASGLSTKTISELDFLRIIDMQFLQRSRTREIVPLFHPHLLGWVLQLQCQNWKALAKEYIDLVFDETKFFVLSSMTDVADETTSGILAERVLEPAMCQTYKELIAKLDELVWPYQKSPPYPTDPKVRLKFEEIDQERQPDPPTDWQGSPADWVTCIKLKKFAEACYESMQYSFVDNVISLAIENCLLSGLPGLFTAANVIKLENSRIEELASESEDVISNRIRLQRDLSVLEDALEICRSTKSTKAWLTRTPPVQLLDSGSPAYTHANLRIPATMLTPPRSVSSQEGFSTQETKHFSLKPQTLGVVDKPNNQAIRDPSTPRPSMSPGISDDSPSLSATALAEPNLKASISPSPSRDRRRPVSPYNRSSPQRVGVQTAVGENGSEDNPYFGPNRSSIFARSTGSPFGSTGIAWEGFRSNQEDDEEDKL